MITTGEVWAILIAAAAAVIAIAGAEARRLGLSARRGRRHQPAHAATDVPADEREHEAAWEAEFTQPSAEKAPPWPDTGQPPYDVHDTEPWPDPDWPALPEPPVPLPTMAYVTGPMPRIETPLYEAMRPIDLPGPTQDGESEGQGPGNAPGRGAPARRRHHPRPLRPGRRPHLGLPPQARLAPGPARDRVRADITSGRLGAVA